VFVNSKKRGEKKKKKKGKRQYARHLSLLRVKGKKKGKKSVSHHQNIVREKKIRMENVEKRDAGRINDLLSLRKRGGGEERRPFALPFVPKRGRGGEGNKDQRGNKKRLIYV